MFGMDRSAFSRRSADDAAGVIRILPLLPFFKVRHYAHSSTTKSVKHYAYISNPPTFSNSIRSWDFASSGRLKPDSFLPTSLVNQERRHQFIDGSAAQLMWRCCKMLQEKHRTRMYMLVEAKLLQSFPEMQVETWVNNHGDSLLGLLHVFIVQESPNCKNAIQRTETGSGCVSADPTACWSMTVQVVHIYTETSHRGKRNSILKQKTKKYIKQVPGIKVPPSSIAKKGTLFYYCFSF